MKVFGQACRFKGTILGGAQKKGGNRGKIGHGIKRKAFQKRKEEGYGSEDFYS
jgi:hypothetical protein